MAAGFACCFFFGHKAMKVVGMNPETNATQQEVAASTNFA
jgi:hypothetical protein